MATHSSVLPWRIPGTAEPGGLPSMGSQRVGNDWSDLAAPAAAAAAARLVITFLVPNKWRKEDREEGSWNGDYKETDFFFPTSWYQLYQLPPIFSLKKNYLLLSLLHLHCCTQAFSSCGESGRLFVVVRRLLIAVASLLGVLGEDSVVVAQGLSCIVACGIFLDQRWDQCPLPLQEDFCLLYHQEGPQFFNQSY